MRKTCLTLIFTAALLSACGREAVNLEGTTVFKADGPVIRYATFANGESPGFHSIRSMKKMPDAGSIEIIDVIPAGAKDLLVVTRKHGIYGITGLGESCARIDRGLPPEVIYPFKSKGITKPVIGHSVSPDGKRIAVVVPCDVYYSADGGRMFSRLPLGGVRRFTELISVALHPADPGLMIIGTSSNGVYVSRDGGITARKIKAGVPGEPVRTPNFLEEIRSLCFGEDGDTFYAGLGNGGGVYRGSISRSSLEKTGPADLVTYPDGDFYRVTSVNYAAGVLFVGTNRGRHRIIGDGVKADPYLKQLFMEGDGIVSARTGGRHLSFHRQYVPPREFKPDDRAKGKQGLYISYSFTQKENYGRLMRLMKHLKLNAVIINLKDDYGSIRVPVSDPVVTQVPGSVNPYVNVIATIRRLKKDGIYVIARQVCFQDPKLYNFRDGKYAVKNTGGAPFHKGPEKWVDGFSEFVWDYNIAVAKALEKAGADEIQFDYIRFPDIRGERETRKFDFRREHQTMREALVSFLKKARSSLDVPVSVDLFGYNAIYQWGEWIGQDVTELSRYVDAISPMFYPSHYTGGYAAGYGNRRIYYTIYLSCKRARELAGQVLLRPYIQAFYYKDNSDGYCVDYIGWELDGLKDSGCPDYIFWNDLSEYTILIRGLRQYRGLGGGPVPPEVRSAIPKKLPFETMVEKKDAPASR
ncbi:MAG TPA: putative glycoside hydrolase [Spirochaetota bacterium]|nr:hypothetical protein [Spirochaetota bacterium]HOD14600.1 putative glycoside hydrolase [Spirochaetota bacterium]HPG50110.1 putative glycoside hydrolase [Spirochaetota bacterium]HPN12469.1 putative glycoside hydrolase [Spirochaetota bacterium]HQL80671.1 putative glycoside hydrolase [Spirochaetota bacterium]